MFLTVLGMLVVAAGDRPGTFSNVNQDSTKYAVFSILDSSASSTTVAVPGKVEKRVNAVMNMTMPWYALGGEGGGHTHALFVQHIYKRITNGVGNGVLFAMYSPLFLYILFFWGKGDQR